MSDNIGTAVDEIVSDRLQLDADAFDDETSFEEDLDAESLDIVELAEAVEATLGVHIPDDDLAELGTVGAFKEYVENHTE
ncbi:acyl carrier protein [Halorubrum pallidum]|uniref:Acyl carrier protein n=1 Tax=Halorubrum pallidum TaxID=1526114 RepID=A0ABD5T4N4_9EURY